jgi:hypothetical protein
MKIELERKWGCWGETDLTRIADEPTRGHTQQT